MGRASTAGGTVRQSDAKLECHVDEPQGDVMKGIRVSLAVGLTGLFCSCSALRYDGLKYLGLGKAGIEHSAPPCEEPSSDSCQRVPLFELEASNPVELRPARDEVLKVRLDEIQFNRSVDGEWRWLAQFGLWAGSLFGMSDQDEELNLFIAVATSDDQSALDAFVSSHLASDLLVFDEERVHDRKHDWFRVQNCLQSLPAVADGTVRLGYMLGYSDSVAFGDRLTANDFKFESGAFGGESVSISSPGEYSAILVLVLEETGHRLLRTIRSAGTKEVEWRKVALKVSKSLASGDGYGAAASGMLKPGFEYAVYHIANSTIDSAPAGDGRLSAAPIDYEYVYLSAPGSTMIPQRHVRRFAGNESLVLTLDVSLEAPSGP